MKVWGLFEFYDKTIEVDKNEKVENEKMSFYEEEKFALNGKNKEEAAKLMHAYLQKMIISKQTKIVLTYSFLHNILLVKKAQSFYCLKKFLFIIMSFWCLMMVMIWSLELSFQLSRIET